MSTPRLKSVYFFYFAGLACLVPFMSLYYQERGMSGAEIGALSGMIPLITWISAPSWGALADTLGRHRAVLLMAIAGAWIAVAALAFAASFPALLMTVIVYAIFVGPVEPMITNTVIALLGERKMNYGRVRLWGAVGWGLAALLIGPLLELEGLHWMFYGFLGLMGVNFILTAGLPMNPVDEMRRKDVGHPDPFMKRLAVLLRNGRFLLLLLVSIVFGINQGIMFSYQFLFLDELGAGRQLMALSLTMSTLSEIPFWFISSALLARFGTNKMIAAALVVGGMRNLGLGAMSNPLLVLPISLLGGSSFAVIYAAGVADADAAAPPGLGATAQGLFAGMMFGLGSALGGFLGGPIAVAIGYASLFTAVGLLCLAMMAAFVAVRFVARRRYVAEG